jgi:hypothetical protein
MWASRLSGQSFGLGAKLGNGVAEIVVFQRTMAAMVRLRLEAR